MLNIGSMLWSIKHFLFWATFSVTCKTNCWRKFLSQKLTLSKAQAISQVALWPDTFWIFEIVSKWGGYIIFERAAMPLLCSGILLIQCNLPRVLSVLVLKIASCLIPKLTRSSIVANRSCSMVNVRRCEFFGHVPILMFVVVKISRSYSNHNLVILICSCELASSNIFLIYFIISKLFDFPQFWPSWVSLAH